jgi:hypothetical protein
LLYEPGSSGVTDGSLAGPEGAMEIAAIMNSLCRAHGTIET